MNWFKLLRYDLRKGLIRRRYAVVPLLFAISCFVASMQTPDFSPGWMDRLLFAFKGLLPLDSPQDFQLPVLWILVMVGCLFLNLDYLLDDLTQEGQQVIVRSVSRRGWFASKCVWNLFSCGLYFLLGILVCLLLALLSGGNISLSNDPWVCGFLLGTGERLTPWEGFLVGILLPYLTVAGYSQLQMTLCLFVKPILSFLGCVCLLVTSLLLSAVWMPGNGAITLRSALLTPGLHSPLSLAVTALCFLAAAIVVGLIRFRHMDLLRYEGE